MVKRNRSEGRSPSVFRQNAKKSEEDATVALIERIADALEAIALQLSKATASEATKFHVTKGKQEPGFQALTPTPRVDAARPLEVARRVFEPVEVDAKRKRKGQGILAVGSQVVARVDGKEFEGVTLCVPLDQRKYFTVLCGDGSEKMVLSRNLRLHDDHFVDEKDDAPPSVTPPSGARIHPVTPSKDKRLPSTQVDAPRGTPISGRRLVQAVAPELPGISIGDRVSYIEDGVRMSFVVRELGIFGASADGRNWVKKTTLTRD